MRRIILLTVLALEGLGGILGGILLIVGPNGQLMNISPTKMHGTFSNFLIPGIILTGMGILTSVASIAVFLKSTIAWLLAAISLVGFTIWFAVEIAILRELHILHIVWGVPVLLGLWAAFPLIHNENK